MTAVRNSIESLESAIVLQYLTASGNCRGSFTGPQDRRTGHQELINMVAQNINLSPRQKGDDKIVSFAGQVKGNVMPKGRCVMVWPRNPDAADHLKMCRELLESFKAS